MINVITQNREELQRFHYIRKAGSDDYWFDFGLNKLNGYIQKFGNDFCLIIIGNDQIEDDYFVLPFSSFKHLFRDETMSSTRNRWVGIIKFNQLIVSNSHERPDILNYRGAYHLLKWESTLISSPNILNFPSDEETNDYYIENRKIEIYARQQQSKFRKQVLKNFGNRCCISNISAHDLLVASHIIPWADVKETRLDPRNGLCLFTLYDDLFDKGYISFTDDLRVLVSQKGLSHKGLDEILIKIDRVKMRSPIQYEINLEYIRFHRHKIFKG